MLRKCLLLVCLITICLTGCNNLTFQKELDAAKDIYNKYKPLTEQEAASRLETLNEDYEFKFNEVNAYNSKHEDTEHTKKIYLYTNDFTFYPINWPSNLEYVTDNSKYIYAKDSSVNVSVVSGIDRFSFSESVLINNGITLAPYLIVTDEKKIKNEIREAALLVSEDKAIVLRTVNNKIAYDKILLGLKANILINVEERKIRIDEKLTETERINFNKEYDIIVTAGLGDSIQKVYSFDDGCLTISRELRKYDDIISIYEPKLVTMADTDLADVYYVGTDIIYIEVGDYVFGAFNLNFNTVYTCYGYGNQAKENTKAYLLVQKQASEKEMLDKESETP